MGNPITALSPHTIWTGTGALLIICLASCAAPPQTSQGIASVGGAATKSSSVASTYLAPASARTHAAADLKSAIDYYARAFATGERIVGTTQYPNADVGLVAMQDPSSAASRFAAWRKSTGIEQNVTIYENAFQEADAFFNASDEPPSVSQCMQDTGTIQSDISLWIQAAVSYQISEGSASRLDAAAATVQADIRTARHDVDLVRQGK